MKKSIITIVDENDNVISSKERGLTTSDDIYRVSALWLTNSNGEVLLAQRRFNKKHDPGKWGPAVAGTVDEGESYESNIYKEAEEEIGLIGVKLRLGPKQIINGGLHRFFCQWFLAKVDKDNKEFKIQETEGEQVAWVPIKRLKDELKNNPTKFTPNAKNWVGMLI